MNYVVPLKKKSKEKVIEKPKKPMVVSRKRKRCSNPNCRLLVDPDTTRCPRCGTVIK